ncbi:MAG: type II and III secretion system protein family protein [Planctomycetota bacterium]
MQPPAPTVDWEPSRLPVPLPVVGREGDAGKPSLPASGTWPLDPLERPVRAGRLELVVGQSRLLTLRRPLPAATLPIIALGDPAVAHIDLLPDGRTLRLIGLQAGATDLSLRTSAEAPTTYALTVGYDVEAMMERLQRVFPEANVKVSQVRGVLILEGQVQYARQAQLIERALLALLPGAVVPGAVVSGSMMPGGAGLPAGAGLAGDGSAPGGVGVVGGATVASGDPRIINLLQIPGQRQVMLQVRIGELNRSALREIGADWFVRWSQRNLAGARIAGAEQTLQGFQGIGQRATAFGIFPTPHVEVVLRALTDRGLLQVMAEPNLVALDGERASFLAGGQFPVPIPQGGGATSANSIQFKEFGVQLEFLAQILDQDSLRLKVAPEVSTIDRSIGTTLVTGGDPVPGLITRKVATTVELRQGETLALAGLLQSELDGRSQRLPLMSDLPYIGSLFTNTSHRRVEKELLVLVSPVLLTARQPLPLKSLPGRDIEEPTDREFFLESRLEPRKLVSAEPQKNNSPRSPLTAALPDRRPAVPAKTIRPVSWFLPK